MLNTDEKLVCGKAGEKVNPKEVLKNSVIPFYGWDLKGIVGVSEKILHHKHFDVMQKFVLKEFKPKNKILLFSLCTNTRPYSTSEVWGKILHFLRDKVDCIILSNPGVIPMQFELSYPFLHYDWTPEQETEEAMKAMKYIPVQIERIKKFLVAFHEKYENIVSYFPPDAESGVALQYAIENVKLEKKFYDIWKMIVKDKYLDELFEKPCYDVLRSDISIRKLVEKIRDLVLNFK